jgi:antitoxin YefM
MRILSSTELRANLARVLHQVAEDHAPVIIHRSTGKPVVMVSLEDWEAMDETTYLTSTPANRAALEAAIRDDRPMVVKTLDELAAMERG